jgi:ribosomal 50S subunit-associated protein YjgA (DUF615 family)
MFKEQWFHSGKYRTLLLTVGNSNAKIEFDFDLSELPKLAEELHELTYSILEELALNNKSTEALKLLEYFIDDLQYLNKKLKG